MKIIVDDYVYRAKIYSKNDNDSMAILDFKKALEIDNENVENQVISLDREKQISPKKNVTWDLKPYNYSSDVKDDLLNESERHYRHHQINAHYLYSEGRPHLKIGQIENL